MSPSGIQLNVPNEIQQIPAVIVHPTVVDLLKRKRFPPIWRGLRKRADDRYTITHTAVFLIES